MGIPVEGIDPPQDARNVTITLTIILVNALALLVVVAWHELTTIIGKHPLDAVTELEATKAPFHFWCQMRQDLVKFAILLVQVPMQPFAHRIDLGRNLVGMCSPGDIGFDETYDLVSAIVNLLRIIRFSRGCGFIEWKLSLHARDLDVS